MMLDIIEWSKAFNPASKPWIILGKGPTFQKIRNIDPAAYHTCSLNHVVRELPVTLAHIIDIDVVADCADAINRNARFLVLPYRPHFKNSPGEKTLDDCIRELPILNKLNNGGRLIWYNLSTSPPREGSPVIKAKFFSAEAALNLLVACGVGVIRSLGVDGGRTYSQQFDDLKDKTLLANGHQSFDRQFNGICETIRRSHVFYAPLHVRAPIRVFVGADSAQTLGVKILEFSIKKHTPMSVEVQLIDDRDVPIPQNPRSRSRSGFSFSRFKIPAMCGYRGRAIYMDADMQVFTDLTRLWTWEMDGADVVYCQQPPERGRPPQYSVMLMDCASLSWNVAEIVQGLDEERFTYEQLMASLCIVPEDRKKMILPFEWNSLEYLEEGKTSLIHYTDMPTQPWVSNTNPFAHVWYKALKEAVQEGFLPIEDLYKEIDAGHVSPELPGWAGLPDPPHKDKLLQQWIPPYRRFSGKPAATEALRRG